LKVTIVLDNIFDFSDNFAANNFDGLLHLIINSDKVLIDGKFLLIEFAAFIGHLLQILDQKLVGGLTHSIPLNLLLIIIDQPGIGKGSFIRVNISNHIFEIPGVSFTHFKYYTFSCLIVSYMLLKVKDDVGIV
jgi:hypothetical protein